MRDYKEIQFNGKPYPVAFNRFALGRFMRSEGITIAEFSNLKEDLETMLNLCYHGLIGGHAAKHEKPLEMSYMAFCMDLGEDQEALAECMALFAEQQGEAEEEAKKKPTVAKAKK